MTRDSNPLCLYSQFSHALSIVQLLLRFEHAWVRAARRALLWVPHVCGMWSEEQHASVVLFEDFVEHHEHRAARVRVTLSHAVHVYEARLHFRAELSGVRAWLHYWFPVSFPLFVATSVFWQLVFVAAAAYSMRDSFASASASQPAPSAISANASFLHSAPRIGGGSIGADGSFSSPLPSSASIVAPLSVSPSTAAAAATSAAASSAVSFVMPNIAPIDAAPAAAAASAVAGDDNHTGVLPDESDGVVRQRRSAS